MSDRLKMRVTRDAFGCVGMVSIPTETGRIIVEHRESARNYHAPVAGAVLGAIADEMEDEEEDFEGEDEEEDEPSGGGGGFASAPKASSPASASESLAKEEAKAEERAASDPSSRVKKAAQALSRLPPSKKKKLAETIKSAAVKVARSQAMKGALTKALALTQTPAAKMLIPPPIRAAVAVTSKVAQLAKGAKVGEEGALEKLKKIIAAARENPLLAKAILAQRLFR